MIRTTVYCTCHGNTAARVLEGQRQGKRLARKVSGAGKRAEGTSKLPPVGVSIQPHPHAVHRRCVIFQGALASYSGDRVGNGKLWGCAELLEASDPEIALRCGWNVSESARIHACVADHVSLSIILCMLGFDGQALTDLEIRGS